MFFLTEVRSADGGGDDGGGDDGGGGGELLEGESRN
jgi:hypothetical protein